MEVKNAKDIKLSINISEIENEMIKFLVNYNNINSLHTYRKTNLIRDLIYNEFIKVNEETFNDLGISINNQGEVIKASIDLGLIY